MNMVYHLRHFGKQCICLHTWMPFYRHVFFVELFILFFNGHTLLVFFDRFRNIPPKWQHNLSNISQLSILYEYVGYFMSNKCSVYGSATKCDYYINHVYQEHIILWNNQYRLWYSGLYGTLGYQYTYTLSRNNLVIANVFEIGMIFFMAQVNSFTRTIWIIEMIQSL